MSATAKRLVVRYYKPVLGVAIGAGAGWAYSYFVGCATGGCPLTSNPLIAAGIGALMGLSISGTGGKKKDAD
jgi:hypothetical protein